MDLFDWWVKGWIHNLWMVQSIMDEWMDGGLWLDGLLSIIRPIMYCGFSDEWMDGCLIGKRVGAVDRWMGTGVSIDSLVGASLNEWIYLFICRIWDEIKTFACSVRKTFVLSLIPNVVLFFS